MNIIDSPSYLTRLSEDGLREILLDEKYNKANLRELVRWCVKELNEQKEAINYYKKHYCNGSEKEILQKIKELLQCLE